MLVNPRTVAGDQPLRHVRHRVLVSQEPLKCRSCFYLH